MIEAYALTWERTVMPNGDGGILKMSLSLDISGVDREKWHIAVAGILRAFADKIEADGLDMTKIGKIILGPGRLTYVER